MKKTVFLMLLVLSLIAWSFSVAFAGSEYRLFWQNFASPKHRCSVNAIRFGDALMAASKGRIKFNYHFGEPVPNKELLNACGAGTIDLFNSSVTYYSGKVGIADFFMMPSNFKSYEEMFDIFMNTELWDIIDKVYRKKSNCTIIYPLALFSDENFQISKKTKKVRRLDDLKGMKIRAAGGAVHQTVKYLGASPTLTISSEYYTAVARGTVDGGLITNYTLQTYKMWEVCHQVVNPPVFPTGTTPVWMNLDSWNSLPEDLQQVFRRVARDPKLFQETLEYLKMKDKEIKKTAIEKYGVEFYNLPAQDAKEMYKKVEPVWDWYVNNCTRQGFGEEAKRIKNLLLDRFYAN